MKRIMHMRERRITQSNSLAVRVGTTGFCGGDSGHGGRTIFELRDKGGTAIKAVRLAGGVRVEVEGDSELATLVEALRWAAATLASVAVNDLEPDTITWGVALDEKQA